MDNLGIGKATEDLGRDKMMKLLGHDVFQKDITQYNEMDLTKHDVIHVHNIDNDLFLKR